MSGTANVAKPQGHSRFQQQDTEAIRGGVTADQWGIAARVVVLATARGVPRYSHAQAMIGAVILTLACVAVLVGLAVLWRRR